MGKNRRRLIFIFLISGVLMMALLFSCAPRFGQNPRGEDLENLERSPHYSGGKFHNQIETPMFAKGTNFMSALIGGMFSSSDRSRPDKPLPSIKTDLKKLDRSVDTVIWLGHSSYLIILNGKRILVDPVLENYAAPYPIFNRAFAGTTIYMPDDIPEIDCLLITHDHWDHLEYPTIKKLMPRLKKVVCPLGVGSHFRYWGYPDEKIQEMDWYQQGKINEEIVLHAIPARHFSGRGFIRDKTLWSGYALISPRRKIFISGDSGYGPHFAEAGTKFDGFDLAIVEDGQYDERWPYIHMLPEESAKAAEELKAGAVMPCHNGRFSMARHAWDEPVARFVNAAGKREYKVFLPIIGEPVFLAN